MRARIFRRRCNHPPNTLACAAAASLRVLAAAIEPSFDLTNITPYTEEMRAQRIFVSVILGLQPASLSNDSENASRSETEMLFKTRFKFNSDSALELGGKLYAPNVEPMLARS